MKFLLLLSIPIKPTRTEWHCVYSAHVRLNPTFCSAYDEASWGVQCVRLGVASSVHYTPWKTHVCIVNSVYAVRTVNPRISECWHWSWKPQGLHHHTARFCQRARMCIYNQLRQMTMNKSRKIKNDVSSVTARRIGLYKTQRTLDLTLLFYLTRWLVPTHCCLNNRK